MRLLATLRDITGDECRSWHTRHAPWAPHPPQCEVPACENHPDISIIWADGLRAVDIQTELAVPLPRDIHLLWVCHHHASVISATVKALGYGSHVYCGGIPADRELHCAEPVPAETLRGYLAAAQRGLPS